MKRVLLLNASWEPLNFISDHRAVLLMFKGRAEVIHNMTGERSVWPNTFFAAPLQNYEVPATLRLLKRVNRKWKPPRFRKKVLFNRDNWSCQYCGEKLVWHNIEIEHIMPSSRGGATSWLNCVAACKPCNKRKANHTPEEAGMKLLSVPAVPNALHFWDITKSNVWHSDWSMFVTKSTT